MKQVDMSDKAVTARLKRVSQLRRLCLSLQKARLPGNESHPTTTERRSDPARPDTQKTK